MRLAVPTKPAPMRRRKLGSGTTDHVLVPTRAYSGTVTSAKIPAVNVARIFIRPAAQQRSCQPRHVRIRAVAAGHAPKSKKFAVKTLVNVQRAGAFARWIIGCYRQAVSSSSVRPSQLEDENR